PTSLVLDMPPPAGRAADAGTIAAFGAAFAAPNDEPWGAGPWPDQPWGEQTLGYLAMETVT
ncbi:MAG: hypothetical protein HQL39_16090, partial [Alphaproteobacteria bacterium]|nr:hypothetical protein [Alphaproteobacteria bacterium]